MEQLRVFMQDNYSEYSGVDVNLVLEAIEAHTGSFGKFATKIKRFVGRTKSVDARILCLLGEIVHIAPSFAKEPKPGREGLYNNEWVSKFAEMVLTTDDPIYISSRGDLHLKASEACNFRFLAKEAPRLIKTLWRRIKAGIRKKKAKKSSRCIHQIKKVVYMETTKYLCELYAQHLDECRPDFPYVLESVHKLLKSSTRKMLRAAGRQVVENAAAKLNSLFLIRDDVMDNTGKFIDQCHEREAAASNTSLVNYDITGKILLDIGNFLFEIMEKYIQEAQTKTDFKFDSRAYQVVLSKKFENCLYDKNCPREVITQLHSAILEKYFNLQHPEMLYDEVQNELRYLQEATIHIEQNDINHKNVVGLLKQQKQHGTSIILSTYRELSNYVETRVKLRNSCLQALVCFKQKLNQYRDGLNKLVEMSTPGEFIPMGIALHKDQLDCKNAFNTLFVDIEPTIDIVNKFLVDVEFQKREIAAIVCKEIDADVLAHSKAWIPGKPGKGVKQVLETMREILGYRAKVPNFSRTHGTLRGLFNYVDVLIKMNQQLDGHMETIPVPLGTSPPSTLDLIICAYTINQK